ncbi:MAG: cation:proton antiporter, partial [Myxococcota bacterium]
MHFEIAFIFLFAIATAVAIAARKLKVPYTVSLVIAGIVLGAAHAFEAPHLTKELLFAVVLPGLLFEAAFHLELKKFLNNKVAIHSLAMPGVVAAIVATGLILTPVADALHITERFTLMHGLVFGALIAATDPIAVVGLFKSLGAPKRLAVLVEGESLLNDGTAVVLFTLILGMAAGAELSMADAVLQFVKVVGMGVLIGLAFGFGASQVIHRVDDPMVEITVTTIAAYGSFAVAEQFHYSGVIATVAAGMLCGNFAARMGMTPSTRIAVESFWEYLAFALNSLVFLLIGFEVQLDSLLASWKAILVAFAAVLLGRALVVAVVTALLQRSKERIPWPWAAVLTWGGLKGGLSMVLVLGIPVDFPHRTLLVNMTFGVVVLSILLQGLTMAPLMRKLRVIGAGDGRLSYEEQLGAMQAANAALAAIEEMGTKRAVHADVVEQLRGEYHERVRQAEAVHAHPHRRAGEGALVPVAAVEVGREVRRKVPRTDVAEALVHVDLRRPAAGGQQPQRRPGKAAVGHLRDPFHRAVLEVRGLRPVAREHDRQERVVHRRLALGHRLVEAAGFQHQPLGRPLEAAVLHLAVVAGLVVARLRAAVGE